MSSLIGSECPRFIGRKIPFACLGLLSPSKENKNCGTHVVSFSFLLLLKDFLRIWFMSVWAGDHRGFESDLVSSVMGGNMRVTQGLLIPCLPLMSFTVVTLVLHTLCYVMLYNIQCKRKRDNIHHIGSQNWIVLKMLLAEECVRLWNRVSASSHVFCVLYFDLLKWGVLTWMKHLDCFLFSSMYYFKIFSNLQNWYALLQSEY